MSEFKNRYVIRRIRLINFHNIQNETIQIENGGHLFLLGDNGSGKTTVLDAIHYVLTAGELVEFNAAARVAGQRAEGRRVQGLIMRYNTETGPMNKDGGVTYAALELKNSKNQVLTVALGMTCAAMDEPVQRWGVVMPNTLDDVPFLIDEMRGKRPRTRLEMKAVLDPFNGFFNVGPFRRELIFRLFENEEVFNDVCRLLRIGKAYREIVAQSSDYHDLFMRLMPEPKTDVFENVILSLQSLEDSKVVLEDFERKRAFINELAQMTERIRTCRQDQICLDWLAQHKRIEKLTDTIKAETQRKEAKQGELRALDEEQQSVYAERELHERRLADLKTKDHAGLVRQEKELASEFEKLKLRRDDEHKALSELKREHGKSLKERQKAVNRLQDFLKSTTADLAKWSPDLPFSITMLSNTVDYLYRQEQPGLENQNLPTAGPIGRTREEIIGLEKEEAVLERESGELAETIASEETRIAQLDAAQSGTASSLPNFREARMLMNLHMIEARPLYECLEWRAGLNGKQKSAVEELIGVEVLSTFMVADKDADQTKTALFKQYPGQRVTHPALGSQSLPEWFRTTFDMRKSDPDALACLAAAVISEREPVITSLTDRQLLTYRGHERRLQGKPARLIGAEGRKKALDREVRELKKDLKEQVARRKELEKKRADLKARADKLRAFVALLEKTNTGYRNAVVKITNLNLTVEHMDGSLSGAGERFDRINGELNRLGERLETMRGVISKEGLANLESRIKAAGRKLEKSEQRLQELVEARGAIKRDIHLIDVSIKDLEAERTAHGKLYRNQADRLREMDSSVGDPVDYVLNTWNGKRFKDLPAVVDARARAHDREVETRARLRVRMTDPSLGASFAFVYDENKNQLLDRRARTIEELRSFQHKTIEDQRQVINDKTFHLFKEIIMRELVNELRKMVFELEDMKDKINRLLSQRRFGKSCYQFTLRPKKEFRQLIDIIAGMDMVRSEPEKELRVFFDDHKQDILNTEAGEIPDLLDYRNWYTFEMQVTVVEEDGQSHEPIAMTRKIKSIGSGGEQAVPNYLLVLTIAHFLYGGAKVRLKVLLFDEAFYGIDAGRRDQLLGFAGDLGLQLFVASPDQDGVKREIDFSTTVLIVKDTSYDVHTYTFDWSNPNIPKQTDLFEPEKEDKTIGFGQESTP